MKYALCLILVISLLCGCQTENAPLGDGLVFRQRLLSGNGCVFIAEVTADYGDVIYQFAMQCQADKQGNMVFTVLSPESITGIKGTITESAGHLTFDGTALAFAPIADGQVTPVTAPWLFLRTLRSGYIASAAQGEGMTYLQIDDSYHDNALHLDIWLDGTLTPVRSEILWEGRRILSLIIKEFTIL